MSLKFIRENIRKLKREYGKPLIFGSVLSSQPDRVTGEQTKTTKQFRVKLAVQLPNQLSFDYLQMLGAQLKGLSELTGTIQILIDRSDVPNDFDLHGPSSYAIFEGERYDVVKAHVYDYAAIIIVKGVGAVIPSTDVGGRLTIIHSLTGSVT